MAMVRAKIAVLFLTVQKSACCHSNFGFKSTRALLIALLVARFVVGILAITIVGYKVVVVLPHQTEWIKSVQSPVSTSGKFGDEWAPVNLTTPPLASLMVYVGRPAGNSGPEGKGGDAGSDGNLLANALAAVTLWGRGAGAGRRPLPVLV